MPLSLCRAFVICALLLASCANQTPAGPAASPTVEVSVIALSDFHGWLSPLKPRKYPRYFGGIENIAASLAGREKLNGTTAILVDNGDMWTGQTEATLLRGEPVVEAYNLLGFAAVNVANHEFDFGPDVLKLRVQQARFPFLGANIFQVGTDQHPEYIRPWTVVERSGVKVGILGLCYIDTPKTTLAKHVEDLEFRGYAATLAAELPKLRTAGAEVVVLLLHDEMSEAVKLFTERPDLKVDLVVAGQNHRKERTDVNGIPVVNPGPFGRSYTRFDVAVDRTSRRVVRVSDQTVDVTGEIEAPPFPPPREMTAVVEAAKAKAKGMTAQRVGELGKPLPTGTFEASPLGHFVVDSWLQAFPEADFAMVNHGGLRQSIASGPVTMGDLFSAMPFENNIRQVRLTGSQVKSQLAIDHPVVGGLTWSYREKDGKREIVTAVDRSGQELDDSATYAVLIIDFMYTGGDGFTFQQLDSNPIDSGISWREPLIRALRRAEASGRALMPVDGVRAIKVP